MHQTNKHITSQDLTSQQTHNQSSASALTKLIPFSLNSFEQLPSITHGATLFRSGAKMLQPVFNSLIISLESFAHQAINIVSYMKPFIFKSTQQPLLLTYEEKKSRKVTTFSANVSASLTLGCGIPPAEDTKSLSKPVTPTFYASVISFFSANPETGSKSKKSTSSGFATKQLSQTLLQFKKELDIAITNADSGHCDAIELKTIKLFTGEIEEHAARRVDAFFYLLVAIYRQQIIITKESTIKQHGKGSKSLNLQACHSSLFPNLKFTALPGFFSTKFTECSVKFQGSHLEDLMNTTVLLPHIVNVFDGYLEGKARQSKLVQYCLSILNQAAKNQIDPREGMNLFLIAMRDYFNFFESKYLKSNKIAAPNSMRKIWEHEKNGTFWAANKDYSVKDEYLYMMLRLKPFDITKVKWFQLLLSHYEKIQKELLEPQPMLKNKLTPKPC